AAAFSADGDVVEIAGDGHGVAGRAEGPGRRDRADVAIDAQRAGGKVAADDELLERDGAGGGEAVDQNRPNDVAANTEGAERAGGVDGADEVLGDADRVD